MTEADDLAHDGRTALQRMLLRLEDQDPCSLAKYEPIPGQVERTGGRLGHIVAIGKGLHAGESGNAQGSHSGFRPTSDHHVRLTGPDGSERGTNRVSTRRTCRHCGVVGTSRPVPHGDHPRSDVADEHRDEEGGHPARPTCDQLPELLFHRGDTTDTASDDDTEPLRCDRSDRRFQTRLFHRLGRGPDRKLQETVSPLDLFPVHVDFGIEVLDLARDPNTLI